jgi:methyl halide transferase
MDTLNTQAYWDNRYQNGLTGWDIGYVSTPLKDYFDQLENKELRILIPGAGNAYEAAYLWQLGFRNVTVLDIARQPLDAFLRENPYFPSSQAVQKDFFAVEGQFDLIVEQTFFCSFPPLPETRYDYARQCAQLLAPGGKLVGLWFDIPLTGDMEKRPFGGSRAEYLTYLAPLFEVKTFEKSHNSIQPRAGNELFGIFIKKT